jgi:CRP/FNR family transcriptional regulator
VRHRGYGFRLSNSGYARFASFVSFERRDLESFDVLTGPLRAVPKGAFLCHEGQPSSEVYRLKSGWLCCSISTQDGARQITKIHLPGDLVGTPSMASEVSVETVSALTSAEVEAIPLEAFGRAFRDHPRLAALLYLWSQEERVRLMHQMTLIGRHAADRRVAAFLLSIYQRVLISTPDVGLSFDLPLIQQDIADATGMSIVHANRSLRKLRYAGLLTFQDGRVTIGNLAGLREFSGTPTLSPRSTSWI